MATMDEFSGTVSTSTTVQSDAQAVSFRKRFPRQFNMSTSQSGSAEMAKLDYSCLIVCNDLGIVVRASLPETFTLDTTSEYNAPFAQGLLGSLPLVGSAVKMLGLQLTSQALTAQVWEGSSISEFQLQLVFQVETDVNKDVLEPLMKLMFLTVPREETEGGLLSAPGPQIDLKKLVNSSAYQTLKLAEKTSSEATKAAAKLKGEAFGKNTIDGVGKMLSGLGNVSLTQVVDSALEGSQQMRNGADTLSTAVAGAIVNSIKNNISIYIGRYLYFPSVVITDVNQEHTVQPMVDGNYTRVEVGLRFRTFYQPTQRDIPVMFPSAGRALRQELEDMSGNSDSNGASTLGN